MPEFYETDCPIVSYTFIPDSCEMLFGSFWPRFHKPRPQADVAILARAAVWQACATHSFAFVLARMGRLKRKSLAASRKKTKATSSRKARATYQLTPFEVGQVKAHLEHGLKAPAIAKRVFKSDGKTPFGETAILNCVRKLEANPSWRGERTKGSARPRKTTPAQDKQVVDWLLDQRGKQKVGVPQLRKQFPFLRKLGRSLVYDRLDEAELAWMKRRGKSIVEPKYLQGRIDYCHGVKRKHQATLEKWAYTDGTVFYLDRTNEEHDNSKRRALGTHVWRRADNRDAMFEDCLGPSRYSKAQGIPVKVWGMLACGVLHIHVLDEGENMDKHLYAELVEDKFDKWRGNCEHLVCDFESCIRGEDALHALTKVDLKLVEGYPVASQDFNAIENAWDILKKRLDVTMPTDLESREDFLKRLDNAVLWVNRQQGKRLWYLSTNQKERAEECLASTPPGGRTTW